MGAAYAAMVVPPQVVTSATVTEQTWEESFRLTGTLVAVQGLTVAAELPGKVLRILFEPGAAVQSGDILVQLDISTEEAQLRAAESAAQLAQAELTRARDLLATGTIARSEFDANEARYQQAVAQADGIRAVIAKKTIRAPFSGRVGLRQVNLGQVLRDGDPITSLQTLDPIYVNFSMPQQRLGQLVSGTRVRVTTDAAPGAVFEGTVGAVDPELDPVTRTVRVQATLSNPDGRLRPGMYANVDVVLPGGQRVLAIPSTAVLFAPYGDSVFVIETAASESTGQPQQTARQQFIRLGSARGDFVQVVSGLGAGDTVVSTGAFKLAPGMPVTIDNTLAPENRLAPNPGNE
jgi:membrane fusion protein (multidrug efflux system)